MVDDPRGGGRPPAAIMTFDGDRPVSMHQYVYTRDGNRWRPARSRVTVFGGNGKPAAVTENDLTTLQTASFAVPGTATALIDGFRRVGGSLSKLVQPDVLFAATMDDASCFREAELVAAATLAEIAGAGFLAAAILACPGTLGLTCLAVIALQIALAGLDLALGVAVADWYLCLNPSPITRGSGGGTGGGGPRDGSGAGCYDITWEISYDGGLTWQFLGLTLQC